MLMEGYFALRREIEPFSSRSKSISNKWEKKKFINTIIAIITKKEIEENMALWTRMKKLKLYVPWMRLTKLKHHKFACIAKPTILMAIGIQQKPREYTDVRISQTSASM